MMKKRFFSNPLISVVFLGALILTNITAFANEMKIYHAEYSTLDKEGNVILRENVDEISKKGIWNKWEEKYGAFEYNIEFEIIGDFNESLEGHFIVIHIPGTYKLQWDDRIIGENGRFDFDDNNVDEIVYKELDIGKYRRIFQLPQTVLSQGNHRLRLSGYRSKHLFSNQDGGFKIQSFDELIVQERWNTITYGTYLVYIVFGIYFLSTFFLKKESLLHFYIGGLCLLFSTYALNKLAYFHLDLSYPKVALIIQAVISINYILCIFAHMAVFEALKFPRKIAWATLILPFLIAYFMIGLSSYGTLKITFEWLLFVSVIAVFQRKEHSLSTSILLSLLVVVYTMKLFEKQHFVTHSIILLYLLFSIVLATYRQHKEKKEAELTNTRLKLELVKNKIQPHFILNSITSAMEWIESDPVQGVSFLNTLAKEFELLSSISEKKLIPLAVEIECCKSYLKVMEFRKKSSYKLVLKDITPGNTLPPSIIRNLLENAITHNSFGVRSIHFHLKEILEKNRRVYEFRSPCKVRPVDDCKNIKEGTGIQYIKARLMESYGSKWKFVHGPDNGDWVTKIEVYGS